MSEENSLKSDEEVGNIDVLESVPETEMSVLDEIFSAEPEGLTSKSGGTGDADGSKQKEVAAIITFEQYYVFFLASQSVCVPCVNSLILQLHMLTGMGS